MAKSKKPEWTAFVGVCVGSDCRKAGSKKVYRAARTAISEAGAKKLCLLRGIDCMKSCDHGPIVTLQPANRWLTNASPEDVADAVTTLCTRTAPKGR